MKFVVIRSNLKDGISAVERASGENLNLPVLRNMLLEANDNKITATATNLEIAISYSIPGKVIENGKITAPIGVLSNVINNTQSDRLNLEKKGNKVGIKTDNYEATIEGLSADDFPITPKIKNDKEFIEIRSEAIKEAVNQVLVATQFSDLRPELNSVLFDFSLDNLKIVATDSFRLAEKTIGADQFSTNHRDGFRVLVPLKTIQELARVLRDKEVLKIYHDNNQILFKTDQLEFLSRLIDGNFPEYGAIIPRKFGTEIVLDRQEFMNSLKLSGIFGSKSGEVKIKVQESKKAIEVASSDQTVGENIYVLSARTSGKQKNETTFNWRYIIDALKILKTDDVFLGINNDNEPAEIKSPGDGSYLYILKPITGT